MIESEPLGSRLKDAAARLSDLMWQRHLEGGMNIRTTDALHAYEEGMNQLALCARWFYGDPVHYERVMICARSILKLMVEMDDGRVHFPSKYIGVQQMQNGYDTISVTPGTHNWAPIRLLFHPVYVAAMYNRHPVLTAKFKQWGRTWRNYQQHCVYVGQVDIKTGKPTIVSKLPSAEAAGPIDEWLAVYQLTDDPKWREPFEFMMELSGYWGATEQYGRFAHALMPWDDGYVQRMRDRFNGPTHGYAGFYLHKDRSMLTQKLDESVAWFSRYRYMNTAAEKKIDRVITHKATTPIACYLGDAARFISRCV